MEVDGFQHVCIFVLHQFTVRVPRVPGMCWLRAWSKTTRNHTTPNTASNTQSAETPTCSREALSHGDAEDGEDAEVAGDGVNSQ